MELSTRLVSAHPYLHGVRRKTKWEAREGKKRNKAEGEAKGRNTRLRKEQKILSP